MKSFHISRWKYFVGYVLVAVFVVASIWAYDKAIDFLGMIAAFIAVLLLIACEFLVRRKRIVVGDAGLQVIEGILSKKVTTIAYAGVSNLIVEQSPVQYLLGFGTVRIMGNFPEIVLENFSLPRKIEKAMAIKRKS